MGLNDAEKYGLLRQAVLLIPDLAQFGIYRSASTYSELQKVVKEYETHRTSYHAVSILWKRSTGALKAGRTSEKPIEEKVDKLAGQLAEISLLVSKSMT